MVIMKSEPDIGRISTPYSDQDQYGHSSMDPSRRRACEIMADMVVSNFRGFLS